MEIDLGMPKTPLLKTSGHSVEVTDTSLPPGEVLLIGAKRRSKTAVNRLTLRDVMQADWIAVSPDLEGHLSIDTWNAIRESAVPGRLNKFVIKVNPHLQITNRLYVFQLGGPFGKVNAGLSYVWHRLMPRESTSVGSVSGVPWKRIMVRGRRALIQRLRNTPLIGQRHAVESEAVNAELLSRDLRTVVDRRFPKYVHLALTNKCNLKCVMCPYHAPSLREQMTTGYFENYGRFAHESLDKLLTEIGSHGAGVTFGQFDEPFVFKGFVDWAIKARELGCPVNITTNGTLFRPGDVERLIDSGIDHISFSLDAATPETYRSIRGADFGVPIQNLKQLVAYRDKVKGRTTIRACLVVQEGNKGEEQTFLELMNEIGIDVVSFYNLSEFVGGVWMNPILNFDVESELNHARYVCSQLYDQVAIYPDGNVALCCGTTMYVGYRDDIPYVGNIAQDTLSDIWLNATYSQIRSEAFRGEFTNSVCRDCTIWHNFHHETRYSAEGFREQVNAYERFVYLRDTPLRAAAKKLVGR